MKHSPDPKEDVFIHLAMCIRKLSKSYDKEFIYSQMLEIAKSNIRTNKSNWNEPLIY